MAYRLGVKPALPVLFVAAHALALGAVLVADNTREFERGQEFVIENWLQPS